jgi:hypothetical protein
MAGTSWRIGGYFLNETKLLLLCKLRLDEALWVEVEQRRLDEA